MYVCVCLSSAYYLMFSIREGEYWMTVVFYKHVDPLRPLPNHSVPHPQQLKVTWWCPRVRGRECDSQEHRWMTELLQKDLDAWSWSIRRDSGCLQTMGSTEPSCGGCLLSAAPFLSSRRGQCLQPTWEVLSKMLTWRSGGNDRREVPDFQVCLLCALCISHHGSFFSELHLKLPLNCTYLGNI